jgi:hypothetical protein
MNDSSARKSDELLMVLHDKDIFPDAPDIVWKERPTGKIVLFNEKDEIALIGNNVCTPPFIKISLLKVSLTRIRRCS